MDWILEKTIFSKRVKYDLEKKNFGLGWKQFLFPVVLRLCGTILPPPLMAKSKFFYKTYLSVTNNETVQNSGSKPKKIPILVYL